MATPDDRDQALCAMVERYQAVLTRSCCLILHDAALAEDAVQETLIKAYRTMDGFRGDCSEKTWLTHIAVNVCRDMLRSGWFRHVDRRVTPDTLPDASSPFIPADEALTLAIMNLPRKQREAVVLYYYQGLDMPETAAALGCAVSTVSLRLKQARQALRTDLERRHFHG